MKKKIAERFGAVTIKENILERRVPKSSWYQGDGATLTTLLIIQIVTGVTMTLYYTNSADHAYDSVQYITNTLPMGWLVRAIHFWTAGIMVVVMVGHFFRHLILGGYKPPREGTWTVGVFQFFLVLTMSFSGYVLRWDERAVYAARVVLNMFSKVPFIGEELVLLVQGAPHIGSLTLTRFHSVHIWIVPLLLVSLVAVHLYLVILHGITAKAEQKQAIETAGEQKKVYKQAAQSSERGEWFYPQANAKIGSMALAVFLLAFTIALVAGPPQLYPEANLIRSSIPQEEWWFWWYSALIAQLPPAIAPIFYPAFPLTLFAGMLLLPILDRGANRGPRKRPVWVVAVGLGVLALLWFSYLRVQSPWTGWPNSTPPPVPEKVVISEKAEEGRLLFSRYGCNSCHAVASQGRRVGPDLARIEHRMSQKELRTFILKPPDDVSMPGYQGRISADDLERVVEFVLVAQTFSRRISQDEQKGQ